MKTDIRTFMITSLSFLLRIKNVSNKILEKNHETHFVFSDFFPQKLCRFRDNVALLRYYYNSGYANAP